MLTPEQINNAMKRCTIRMYHHGNDPYFQSPEYRECRPLSKWELDELYKITKFSEGYMKDTRYKGQETLKSRYINVQDWRIVFDAIVCLKPDDIRAIDTIDAHDSIRSACDNALGRIRKEMEERNG